MKYLKETGIIQGFALLHAAVSLGCRAANLTDDMMLTLLTMTLVVILCLRSRVSWMVMAVLVVAVNVVGVLLGLGTSSLLSLAFSSPLVIYPLSTLVSTEIIGYLTLWITVRWSQTHRVENDLSIQSLRMLFIAFVVILITRLAILLLLTPRWEGYNVAMSVLLDYSATLAALVVLATYALRLQTRAKAASEAATAAQYRYHTLKQQVNPHFLFNSLNVLDCLIQEQSPEDASRYTHKLADIYRYMLKTEDATTVRLQGEMDFVSLYTDLLKVRFPQGLEVQTDIPEAALSRSVVPCCLQLLVENATKHNAVQPERPLHVRISADTQSVSVHNNRNPKLTRAASTGLGLQYIRQQYLALSGKEITVEEDEDNYTVTLPLL